MERFVNNVYTHVVNRKHSGVFLPRPINESMSISTTKYCNGLSDTRYSIKEMHLSSLPLHFIMISKKIAEEIFKKGIQWKTSDL